MLKIIKLKIIFESEQATHRTMEMEKLEWDQDAFLQVTSKD